MNDTDVIVKAIQKINFNRIPEELKKYKNWVLWNFTEKDGKKTKIPLKSWKSKDLTQKGKPFEYMASTTIPEHWDTYENVKKAFEKGKHSGIGFVLTDTPFTGFDIDNCIDETGIKERAYEIIKTFDTYTEVSPSGKGVKGIVRAKKESDRCKNPKWDTTNDIVSCLEIYDTGRFFTFTGRRLQEVSGTIQERQEELNNIICEHLEPKKKEKSEKKRETTITLTEREIIEKATNAKNGSKFRDLYNGKWEGNYTSQSDADQAFCNMVAFYTKDFTTIDSIFRSSGLNRVKWNRDDYKTKTIENAINTVSETYNSQYTTKSSTPEPQEWEEIIPLDSQEIPDFPIHVFDKISWLKNFIFELSEQSQTDTSLTATTILSVLSTSVQNKFKIEVKKGWQEQLNIYSMVAMSPSERKSAVFKDIVKPLQIYEMQENTRLEPLVKKNRQEKEMLIKRIEHLQKLVIKGGRGSDEAEKKLFDYREELENFKDIKRITLCADDITPERLVTLMCENGGNMSIASSEGGIIGTLSGRYAKNGNINLDVFLKAYDGEYLKVDRQTRESVSIPRPALSIGLSLQPVVMNSFIENKELRERGLCARFLYCVPSSKIGKRIYDSESMNYNTLEAYRSNIEKLIMLPYANEEQEIKILTLSNEAHEVSKKFMEKLEKKLINEYEHMKDWAGKLHGKISRIAGLLHIAENIDNLAEENPFYNEISKDTYQRAIILGEFYLKHAENIFGTCSGNEIFSNAVYLIKKLKKLNVKTINKSDLQQKVKATLSKEDFETALNILIDHNYLCVEVKASKGAGRKAEFVVLSPHFLL